MIINHPLLGPRDAAEFTYFGDASLIDRPNGAAENSLLAFIDYGCLLYTSPSPRDYAASRMPSSA